MAGKRIRCGKCGNIFPVPVDVVEAEALPSVPAASQAPGSTSFASQARPTLARSATGGARRSDEIDYEVFGDDIQYAEVTLDPGEMVIAEVVR